MSFFNFYNLHMYKTNKTQTSKMSNNAIFSFDKVTEEKPRSFQHDDVDKKGGEEACGTLHTIIPLQDFAPLIFAEMNSSFL